MSPACDAVIEHVPTARMVTATPLTVQIDVVVDTRLTGRFELDDADRLNVAVL